MSILGETLEAFDDDGLIPAFGFGDVSTKDKAVFPFLSQVWTVSQGGILMMRPHLNTILIKTV